MIDPTTLIKPTSSLKDKQIFLLFCVFVAGRNSDIATNKLANFLSDCPKDVLPFDYLKRKESSLHDILATYKVGQYNRIEAAIKGVIRLDVEKCSLEELLGVYGIGMKTAKFFLVYSRGGRHAVLDVHILKWLRREYSDAPKNTPPPEQYNKWEARFFYLAEKEFGKDFDLTKIDLLIWSKESGRL